MEMQQNNILTMESRANSLNTMHWEDPKQGKLTPTSNLPKAIHLQQKLKRVQEQQEQKDQYRDHLLAQITNPNHKNTHLMT